MIELVDAVRALGPGWLDPQKLPDTFGNAAFWVAVFMVFAECGLLIGFFLPGDSLLFIVGLLIAGGQISITGAIAAACVVLSIAAVAGNLCGYAIGYRAGPALFKREDSRFFKRAYVDRTHEFFDRHGVRAIVLARFVPIVRTFITAMAGVGRMDFRRYTLYSVIGGTLWATGITLLGYWLGNHAFIKNNIDIIAVLIVALSVTPIGIHWLRERRRKGVGKGAGTSAGETTGPV
jgi:membrane-associated protein